MVPTDDLPEQPKVPVLSDNERRDFVRHPGSVTLDCWTIHGASHNQSMLRDIGRGGLCIHTDSAVPSGTPLVIRFDMANMQVQGTVAWQRPEDRGFSVGVVFNDPDARFAARMMEQMCQIEAYRSRVRQQEGRDISGDEAAKEWIDQYASAFPDLS